VHTLRKRIETESGLSIATRDDLYALAGLFNKYRPDGVGLERLLAEEGVEGLCVSGSNTCSRPLPRAGSRAISIS